VPHADEVGRRPVRGQPIQISDAEPSPPRSRRRWGRAVSGISYGTATVAGNGSITRTWQY
jgi:hypothetical protein